MGCNEHYWYRFRHDLLSSYLEHSLLMHLTGAVTRSSRPMLPAIQLSTVKGPATQQHNFTDIVEIVWGTMQHAAGNRDQTPK